MLFEQTNGVPRSPEDQVPDKSASCQDSTRNIMVATAPDLPFVAVPLCSHILGSWSSTAPPLGVNMRRISFREAAVRSRRPPSMYIGLYGTASLIRSGGRQNEPRLLYSPLPLSGFSTRASPRLIIALMLYFGVPRLGVARRRYDLNNTTSIKSPRIPDFD